VSRPTGASSAPTAATNALVAGMVSELRSPLARVELAASQLVRELATPGARALAACISEAVREADGGIERILPLLVPGVRSFQSAELGTVVARVCERLAPVLDARGTALVAGRPAACGARGDPRLFEQAALGLVRAGAILVGPGGRLELGLNVVDGQPGVALCGSPGAGQTDAEAGHAHGRQMPDFTALRSWAMSHGGALTREVEGGNWRVVLWLPGEDPRHRGEGSTRLGDTPWCPKVGA